VLNTTVTLTGSSQVALARNPKARAVARRDPDQQYAPQPDQIYAPQYDAGDSAGLAPQGAPRQILPQARADDGYIYPADGSSSDPRYPAPRSRRVYDGQVYYYQQQQQQQQQTYDGYGNQYQQQPRYYQQRGLY